MLGVDSLVTNKRPEFAVAGLLGWVLVSVPHVLSHLFPRHCKKIQNLPLTSPPNLFKIGPMGLQQLERKEQQKWEKGSFSLETNVNSS